MILVQIYRLKLKDKNQVVQMTLSLLVIFYLHLVDKE